MAVSRTLFKDIQRNLINEKNVYAPAVRERLMVLCHMIYSCLVTQNCSIQKMGEHIATVAEKDSESGVKQAKRWLKSQYTDYDLHFFTYLSPLLTILSATGELILVIDGSETGKNVLVYSLAWFMVSVPFLFVGLQEKAKKGIFHRKCT